MIYHLLWLWVVEVVDCRPGGHVCMCSMCVRVPRLHMWFTYHCSGPGPDGAPEGGCAIALHWNPDEHVTALQSAARFISKGGCGDREIIMILWFVLLGKLGFLCAVVLKPGNWCWYKAARKCSGAHTSSGELTSASGPQCCTVESPSIALGAQHEHHGDAS